MRIVYSKQFLRQLSKLDMRLQDEIIEKIELFKLSKNKTSFKVHKLHGELKEYFSFSVNYSYRIVFEYLNKDEIALLRVGDHDIYK